MYRKGLKQGIGQVVLKIFVSYLVTLLGRNVENVERLSSWR
jgi:hypothetical protein